MTLATDAPSEEVFAGANSAAPLQIQWRFIDANDLVVTAIVDGVEDPVPLTRGIDYQVAGGGTGGGTVTPLAPRATGTSWRVRRETPKGQPASLPSAQFNPKQIEQALDRQGMAVQELAREGERAFKVPRGTVAPVLSLDELYAPAEAAADRSEVAADRAEALALLDGYHTTVAAGVLATVAPATFISDEVTVDNPAGALRLYDAAGNALPVGLPLRGFTNSATLAAALARAVANEGGLIAAEPGAITLTGDFAMARATTIDLTGATITAAPDDILFDFGWNQTGTINQKGQANLRGGNIRLQGVGKKAIGVMNAGANNFREQTISMLAANQVAYDIYGNIDPNAPYGGLIESARVRGNATPGAGQIAYRFGGPQVEGSLTPNRWDLTNIMDCAAVDGGFEFEGGDGDTMTGFQCESCYDFALRFGHGTRTHAGAVTTVGGSSATFTDTSLIGLDLDNAANIEITSGANDGESARIVSYDRTTGVVQLANRMPFQFGVGDTYVLTEAKSRNWSTIQGKIEQGVPTTASVHFTAGAIGCKVHAPFFTQIGGVEVLRDIEDISNTVAKRYKEIVYEATLDAADGAVWLTPGHTSSVQGGGVSLEGGWIDAVTVTGAVRGTGTAGTIDVEVFVNGAQLPAQMTARLTEQSPNYARRVLKSRTAASFISEGQTITARATKAGMTLGETLRVTILVGFAD